jgi:hypothetical protein
MIGDGMLPIVYEGKLLDIRRSQVDEYCDDEFWSGLDLWSKWRVFEGMPFAGGWAEQPAHIVDMIGTIERAFKDAKD